MHMATKIKRWTLEELHSLPDDGNKYELVHGELFVTPTPTPDHETIISRLSRILESYVAEHRLGLVYHPRAVLRFKESEVEPDLMVRQLPTRAKIPWEKLPVPILIVEVLSDSTWRRDHGPKRDFYMEAGVGEYWIVDGSDASITSVRKGEPDRVISDQLVWTPEGAAGPLVVDVPAIFRYETR